MHGFDMTPACYVYLYVHLQAVCLNCDVNNATYYDWSFEPMTADSSLRAADLEQFTASAHNGSVLIVDTLAFQDVAAEEHYDVIVVGRTTHLLRLVTLCMFCAVSQSADI